MRLLEFLSMVALSPAIFSIIYLSELRSTVSSVMPRILPRIEEGSKYPVYFHMLFEKVYNSSGLNRSCDNWLFLSLSGDNLTDIKDVFRLFLYFLENIIVLLFEKISHFLQTIYIRVGILSIISSVTSAKKSSIENVYYSSNQ